jgi:hypothetical protein
MALLHFIKNNENITCIEQNYSEPGHGYEHNGQCRCKAL